MSGQDETKSLKEKVLSILPTHDSSRTKDFDNQSVRTFDDASSKGSRARATSQTASIPYNGILAPERDLFRNIDHSQEISALAVAAAAKDMPNKEFNGGF
ncbi:hypothetical protein N7481_005862 [Penicillium waksmanii]|uniref:uncharacterized protein n=1 Tax=Penicillium waksmanii TaxID=69791 RepID=UPI002547599F|nr:uncharacterized protein N7481_005862 [Penicillium waksmanii]KAJ5983763.1 hypothetical protein N7481_005862 [Penicillium waksmanii]